ncbi:MAG: hypothetical protein F4087_15350 [Gemmatimonadetes bacterium]|nr:hypothetical protein [Gemmatimonadota bacterium]MYE69744.1 hypothetical protein [Gemmatimonadota bacterium]MYJ69864.1 hypothetical protein [Gemmatimonadota bacterium]
MSTLIATVLLTSAGWLPVGAPAPDAGALKCGAREAAADMPNVAVILDDAVLSVEETTRVDRDFVVGIAGLKLVEVVCWNWVEEHYGPRVRQGGILLYTEDYVERTRANGIRALDALIAAQARHRDEHGEYAAGVEDLPGFALSDYDLPGYFELTLESGDGGWTARVGPAADWSRGLHYRPEFTCRAFAGAVPERWASARRDGQPALRQRQPVCS